MMTPLGSEGGLHEMVSCTAPGVADRSDTGPGTVVYKLMHSYVCIQSTCTRSPSCSVTTVNSLSAYGPVPLTLIAAT